MGLFSYEFPCSLVFPFLSSPLDSSYHIINSYNWQRFHTNFFRVFSDLRKTKADFGLFYPTEKNARVQALSLLPLFRVRFARPPSPEGEGSRSKVKPPLKGKAVAPKSSHPLRRHEARDAGGIPERCRTQRGGRGVPRRMILHRMGCRISSPSSGFASLAHLPPRGKAAAPRLSRPSKGKQSLRG